MRTFPTPPPDTKARERALVERLWASTLRPAVERGTMTAREARFALAAALKLRRRGVGRREYWMNDDALVLAVERLVVYQQSSEERVRNVFRFLEGIAPRCVLQVAGTRAEEEHRQVEVDSRLAARNLHRLGLLVGSVHSTRRGA